VAVAIKAAFSGLKVPDGLLLEYPLLDLTSTVRPSRLLFMEDPILPWNSLKVFRDAYGPAESIDLKDPYVSPLYASDTHLAALPSIYLCVGEYDPLLDEAVQFMERLKNSKRKMRFRMYEGLPHGFLSMSKQVPEAKEAMNEAAEFLKEILS